MPPEDADTSLPTSAAGAAVAERPRGPAPDAGPDVPRILRLSVPLIAQLARRTMSIAAIRKLAPGAIIEFDRAVDEDLDLLINNRPIGRGRCVKVDEKFGLRITQITDRSQRIRSLGP